MKNDGTNALQLVAQRGPILLEMVFCVLKNFFRVGFCQILVNLGKDDRFAGVGNKDPGRGIFPLAR